MWGSDLAAEHNLANQVLAEVDGLDVNEEAVRESQTAAGSLGDEIAKTLGKSEGVFVVHEAVQGGAVSQSGHCQRRSKLRSGGPEG